MPRGRGAAARGVRSVRFCAWAALAVQLLFVAAAAVAASTRRSLGFSQGWLVAVLVIAVALPVLTSAAWLWTSRPVREVTSIIRRRAAGDYAARAVPRGVAEYRELARSLNVLADESDRMRIAGSERNRLLAEARDAAIRIRAHLSSSEVIREAVVTLQQKLPADGVEATLIVGQDVRMAEAAPAPMAEFLRQIPRLAPDVADWCRAIYRDRITLHVRDLQGPEATGMPRLVLEGLAAVGARTILLVPFGDSEEALGLMGLMRSDLSRPWTPAEIETVESLAIDIGRGLHHARLYEAEQRLVAELESLDRAKANFIASASHDLRTPLTSIAGYVELLQDTGPGPLTAEQAQMLVTVARNTRRLRNLIEDMLTISKIDLGSFESDLRPVSLAELVRAAAEAFRPAAVEHRLTFQVTVSGGGLIVNGDAGQLDRVMMNLLSNAVKYTPQGGRVSLAAGCEDGHAVLEVTDSGIGIPAAEQHDLFSRFFRASNAVERAIQGSGLGLSIVQAIVSNHHGDVSLESREGAGTTVTVRLPLQTSQD